MENKEKKEENFERTETQSQSFKVPLPQERFKLQAGEFYESDSTEELTFENQYYDLEDGEYSETYYELKDGKYSKDHHGFGSGCKRVYRIKNHRLTEENIYYWGDKLPSVTNSYQNGIIQHATKTNGSFIYDLTFKNGKVWNGYISNTIGIRGISRNSSVPRAAYEDYTITYQEGKENGVLYEAYNMERYGPEKYDVVKGDIVFAYEKKNGEYINFVQKVSKSDTNDHNQENGTRTTYYPNGAVKATESYQDGQLNGFSRQYDEDGNIIEQKYYRNGIDQTHRYQQIKKQASKNVSAQKEMKVNGKSTVKPKQSKLSKALLKMKLDLIKE